MHVHIYTDPVAARDTKHRTSGVDNYMPCPCCALCVVLEQRVCLCVCVRACLRACVCKCVRDRADLGPSW